MLCFVYVLFEEFMSILGSLINLYFIRNILSLFYLVRIYVEKLTPTFISNILSLNFELTYIR